MPTNPQEEPAQVFGPWNPGIQSVLPAEFLPLATVFSAANVSSSIGELKEISSFCGLPLERLSTFTPERLALHEVLVRVMADLSVPDGDKYEDLGINFRHMTATIMRHCVAPELAAITSVFERVKREAADFLDKAQDATACPERSDPPASGTGRRSRFFFPTRRGTAVPAVLQAPERADVARIAGWRSKAQSARNAFERACYQALVATADGIFAVHGRLANDRRLTTAIALRLVCNDYGSRAAGEHLAPLFVNAVRREGYRLLPAQSNPLVMNVKGAPASGKSTLRPLQKQLAAELGVNWADFALISPDIWRKYLLDYDSLGRARKYAGTLTAAEVAVIDEKLDRYMGEKARLGALPHLLIDRFRFDSFAPDEEDGSRLLTRFGSDVYMFFMITPPEATIERAWKRGLQFGRYKAVDDLLAHNVEAYSGIPGLFFTWALRQDKRVHFEFLDNSVAEGERPRTVAFGLNGTMNILDLTCLLDIDRYRSVNIAARTPPAIYARPSSRYVGKNPAFLKQCLRCIPTINFAEQQTGRIWARIAGGRLTYWNRQVYQLAVRDDDTRAAFESVAGLARRDATGS
ncbi:MAG: hypothetical protein J2P53_11390, partial [Bradyrhizobiaceae bacterium]|nr:hypothetical protein [Bradyrhizobiaceae bacterium]